MSARNTILLLTQGAILGGAALIATYIAATVMGLEPEAARTVAFTTLVISQLLHALSVRAAGHGAAGRPGPLLIGSLAGSAILQLVVIYTAFGNTFLHTEPLSMAALGLSLAAALASMIAVRAFNRVAWSRRRTA